MTEKEAKKLMLSRIKRGDEVFITRGKQKGFRGKVRKIWDAGQKTMVEILSGALVDPQPHEALQSVTADRKIVDRIWPGLEPNQNPKEGWCALLQRQSGRYPTPSVGDSVRKKSTMPHARVGFISIIEGDVLGCDFSETDPQLGFAWIKPSAVLVSLCDKWMPYAEDVRAEPAIRSLMDRVHEVKPEANTRQWGAYDKKGNFLFHMPAKSASHFLSEQGRKDISSQPE